MQPRGRRGSTGVPSEGTPGQSATEIAPQIPKRVGLGLARNQVPAAGVGTLLAAARGAQGAGAGHPITPGAQAEIRGRETER